MKLLRGMFCLQLNLSSFYSTKIVSSTTFAAEQISHQVAPSYNNPCEAPQLKSDILRNVQDEHVCHENIPNLEVNHTFIRS